MSSGPPPLCNSVWLIIITCYSGLTAKLQAMSADVAGTNQKHAQALTTPGVLSDADEHDINVELEDIESAIGKQHKRIIAIQDMIQARAEAFNKAHQPTP